VIGIVAGKGKILNNSKLVQRPSLFDYSERRRAEWADEELKPRFREGPGVMSLLEFFPNIIKYDIGVG
jgi:hypothetical protein